MSVHYRGCNRHGYPVLIAMTPDDLYKMGYEDAKNGKAMNASHMDDPNYSMGYEDGKGDWLIEKPVSNEYTTYNDPPEGFEFTGEKRVPKPYEFYLSKNGNPTFLERERKNSQTRYILRCAHCSASLAWKAVGPGKDRCWCDHGKFNS